MMSASVALFFSPIALRVAVTGIRGLGSLPVPLLALGAWVVVFLYGAEWRWLLGRDESR